jgi:hypothetical protein
VLRLILILPIHVIDTHQDATRKNSFNIEVRFLIIATYSETAQNGAFSPYVLIEITESLVAEHPANCQ